MEMSFSLAVYSPEVMKESKRRQEQLYELVLSLKCMLCEFYVSIKWREKHLEYLTLKISCYLGALADYSVLRPEKFQQVLAYMQILILSY